MSTITAPASAMRTGAEAEAAIETLLPTAPNWTHEQLAACARCTPAFVAEYLARRNPGRATA